MGHFFRTIVLLLSFVGCGGAVKKEGIQLGVDPNWYPLDFGKQASYVNGFVEEVIFEVASYSNTDYVKQIANADHLLSGLHSGEYDAVLTSLSPHNFKSAKYDFSQNFLSIGPVLIVPIDSSLVELSEFNEKLVGTLVNDPSIMILQKFPEIIMRSYSSIPDLLNALVATEIEAVLLDRLVASAFIRDLYSEQLKIVGDPLTNAGLRLITLKGKHSEILKQFDQTLSSMKKKKMKALLQKWNLG